MSRDLVLNDGGGTRSTQPPIESVHACFIRSTECQLDILSSHILYSFPAIYPDPPIEAEYEKRRKDVGFAFGGGDHDGQGLTVDL